MDCYGYVIEGMDRAESEAVAALIEPLTPEDG